MRERHVAQLRVLFAGQAPEHALFLKGTRGKGTRHPYVEPERWVEEALDDLAARADALRDGGVFRPLALEFGPYGVHFIDKILGAEVFDLGDGDEPKWSCMWIRVSNGGPLYELLVDGRSFARRLVVSLDRRAALNAWRDPRGWPTVLIRGRGDRAHRAHLSLRGRDEQPRADQ
jgi:hypothetical protein